MKEETLATEMLREINAQSKRWFIISVILLIALVGSNIGWIIYESQYEEATSDEIQTIEDIDNSSNSNYSQTIK